MPKKTKKLFKKSLIKILILTVLTTLTISGIVEAKFYQADQLTYNTFILTSNIKADYCIITSKNVKEIARDAELCDAYRTAWNNAEDRNDQLQKQADMNVWYFTGGFVLGVLIFK